MAKFGWAYIDCSDVTPGSGSEGPAYSLQFVTESGGGTTGSALLSYYTASQYSYDPSTMVLSGNLIVTGAVSASVYHIQNIAIIDATGSSKMGDSNDDHHFRTGSFVITKAGVAPTAYTLSASVVDSRVSMQNVRATNYSGSGTMEVVGNTFIGGTLNVTGAVTVAGIVAPKNDNSQNLGSAAKKWANVFYTNASGSGTLQAVGATTLGSTLNVSGNATLAGTTSAQAVTFTNASGSGTLQAVGATFLGNTLAVTGAVTIGNDVDGTDRTITFGHSTLKSIMGIDDSADAFVINTDNAFDGTLANNSLTIDASHNMTVAGNIDGAGDLTMATITMTGFTVDADGDTALKTLAVDDGSTIGCDSDTDLLTLSSNILQVKGAISGSGTLHNVGAATFGGTVATTGSLTVNSSTSLDGAVTINESGADADFRVESADESHMIFVDASANRVSIGDNTGTPGATLEVKNHASAGASGVPLVQLNSNDTDQQCLDINAGNITANVVNITANDVTTARVLAIGADGLTTGNAFYVDDNSSDTGTRNTAIVIQNNAAAIAATAFTVQSDGGVTGVKLDKNYSDTTAATVTGLNIDFDKTGTSTSNNTMYGIKLDMDNTTATNGNNYMYGLHVTPTLTHAADAGGTFVYGALINAQGGTNGSSLVQGARIEAGGGDINYGLQLDVEDGGVDLRIESSADSGDYFQIQTTTHGATTITTVDDDAAAADLTFTIDGDIILGPAGGDVLPDSDNARNLGSPAKRWANIYTGDLHLRNERGDWTIVEEEDYLCVINNKTGKKFKMNLIPLEDDE